MLDFNHLQLNQVQVYLWLREMVIMKDIYYKLIHIQIFLDLALQQKPLQIFIKMIKKQWHHNFEIIHKLSKRKKSNNIRLFLSNKMQIYLLMINNRRNFLILLNFQRLIIRKTIQIFLQMAKIIQICIPLYTALL